MMDILIKRASALTTEEKVAVGIVGIPANWPVEKMKYEGVVPEGYELISEGDLAILVSNNQAAYDAWIAALRPVVVAAPENPVSAMGHILVENAIFTGPIGSRSMSIVTPDLGDRTTWYQKSVKVTEEVLENSGDGLTYNSANPHWIDIYSLRFTAAHARIVKRDGTSGKHVDWAVTVKVDGVVVIEGFSINYATGKVVFADSKAGSVIVCTYWHNNGVDNPSEWLLVPPAGKKYLVEHTELNFSVGLGITNTLRFEIWAGANLATYGSFPDYLFDAGYGQMRADYRNANDLISTANLGQGVVAKFGGLQKEVVVMPFNYMQAFELNSSVGIGSLFRMVLLGNEPYTDSEIATGAFYVQLLSV